MSISEGSGDVAGSSSTYGWANVSGQVVGNINPYNDSDWYATYLLAGVTYTFQMYGRDLDSYLVLHNSSGTQLQFANRAGTGVAETITFTPGSSGLYYLDAQSYWTSANNRGLYTVSLASNVSDDFSGSTTTTSQLQLGQTRNGVLETASDADWHRVQLVAGKAYSFQSSGTLGARAYLKLFDPDALATGSAGAGGFTFTATRSGTYYLEVSGMSFTDTGSYALRVNEVPTVSIDSKAFFEGSANPGTVNFVVKLSAASLADVTVKVDSVDYTALAGLDYQAVHRTITIPAGQTSVLLPVPVYGNTDFQAHRVFGLSLSGATNAQAGPLAYGYINDDDAPASLQLPTDDQLGFQWYLYTVRADWAWQLATGKGVKVGVFDQGVDAGHADLKANINLALGRNAATLSSGGTPQTADDKHGTWVAGVIASARDGHGTVGVAYDAQIVPIYSSLVLNAQYLKEIANAFTYAKTLDVLNNSWGFGNLLASGTNWAFLDNANDPAYAPAFAALKDLVSNGRKGLGTIVVQSAGNGYDYGDDTNLHNFQNSRYVITVGATDYHGHASTFSTTGASILVSAPGGGGDRSFDSILSTDRVGSAGDASGDYAYVDGTSFSAPIVSGVVAMMLEANPRLGYRDVQQILAYTARQTDIDVGVWDSNGAANWNGGGLHYNGLIHAAGFGQVDALAAVRLAASWQAPALTAANAKEISVSRAVNAAIPDDGGTGGVHSGITVTDAMVVERVDVAINIKHSFVGDLSILLTSPSGTTSFLLWRPSAGALSSYGSSQDDIHFTFDTVLDWGENAQGLWTLGVYDNEAGDVGTLIDWRMNIVGRAASADDNYVYTNEYPDIVAADPARAVLRDSDGGNDTLNAAALGLDNRIDLSGRSASVLNGAPLTIAPGVRVSTAIGGDGDDTLIASDSGCTLRGMGGNDTLLGGAGGDRLEGGLGNDFLSGSTGIDFAVFDLARAGARLARMTGAAGHYTVTTLASGEVDELSDIERLQFSDLSLALDVSGNAGAVAKLIGAVFGPARLADEKFVGNWLAKLDAGMSYADAVAAAVNSSDFAALAGSHLNTSFVTQVYKNVVGVAPDAATRDSFVSMITHGQYTQATLAMLGCELDLNANNVHLAGLADTGLEYLPAGG